MGDIFKFSDLVKKEEEIYQNQTLKDSVRPDPNFEQGRVSNIVTPFKFPKERIDPLDFAIINAKDLKNSGNEVEITMNDIRSYFPEKDPQELAKSLKDKGYKVTIPAYEIWDLSKPAKPANVGVGAKGKLTMPAEPEDYSVGNPRWKLFYQDLQNLKAKGYNVDENNFLTPEQQIVWTVFKSKQTKAPAEPNLYLGTSYAKAYRDVLEANKIPVKGAEISAIPKEVKNPVQIGPSEPMAPEVYAPTGDAAWGTFEPVYRAIENVATAPVNAAVQLGTLGKFDTWKEAFITREGPPEARGLSKVGRSIANMWNKGLTDENMGEAISGAADVGMSVLAIAGPGAAKAFMKFVAVDEAANLVVGERPVSRILGGIGKSVSNALQEGNYGPGVSDAIGNLTALGVLGAAMKAVHGRADRTESVKAKIEEMIKTKDSPMIGDRKAAFDRAIDYGGIEKMATDAIEGIDKFVLDNAEYYGRPDLARRIGDIRYETSTEPSTTGEPNQPKYKTLDELTPQEQTELSKIREEAMTFIEQDLAKYGVKPGEKSAANEFLLNRGKMIDAGIADNSPAIKETAPPVEQAKTVEAIPTEPVPIVEPARPAPVASAEPVAETKPDIGETPVEVANTEPAREINYPSLGVKDVTKLAAQGDTLAVDELVRRGVPEKFRTMPQERLTQLAEKGLQKAWALAEIKRRSIEAENTVEPTTPEPQAMPLESPVSVQSETPVREAQPTVETPANEPQRVIEPVVAETIYKPERYDAERLRRLQSIENKLNRRGYEPLEDFEIQELVKNGDIGAKGKNKGKLTDQGRSALWELNLLANRRSMAEGNVYDRTAEKLPVTAREVETYELKLPEGYVREGDSYVYKEPSPVETQPNASQTEPTYESRLIELREKGVNDSAAWEQLKNEFPDSAPKIFQNFQQIYNMKPDVLKSYMEKVVAKRAADAGQTQPVSTLRNTIENVKAERLKTIAEIKQTVSEIASGNKAGMALPVELMAQYAKVGGLWIVEKGLSFAEFSKAMLEEFGNSIRPYLAEVYSKAQDYAAKLKAEKPATETTEPVSAPAQKLTPEEQYKAHEFETNRPESIEAYRKNPDYTETDMGNGYFKYTPVNRLADTGPQVLDRMGAGFDKQGETKVENAKKEKQMAEANNSGSRFWDRFIYSFIRKSERAESKLENIARGQDLTPELRKQGGEALNAIGKIGYTKEITGVVTHELGGVAKEVRDTGITEKEWNSYLALHRGINDPGRADMLTYGYTPEVMQRGMDELRTRMGEEKFAKMEKIQSEKLVPIWQEVLKGLNASGMISDDSYEKALANTAYAPFQHDTPIRELYDNVFGSGSYEGYHHQIMKESVGSIGVSAAPFTEMVIKAQAYTHMMLENNARRLIADTANEMNDFLRSPEGGEVKKPGRFWMKAENPKNALGDVVDFTSNERFKPIPKPPNESGMGLLEYYDNGGKKGIWIAEEIADHFNDKKLPPIVKAFQWNLIRTINSFQRQTLTSSNPFFRFRNLPKDIFGSVGQNAGMRLLFQKGNFLGHVIRQYRNKELIDFVKSDGKIVGPTIKEAMEEGITSEQIQYAIDPATSSESLMLAMGKEAFFENMQKKNQTLSVREKFLNWLKRGNVKSEIAVKLAGKEWYKQHRTEEGLRKLNGDEWFEANKDKLQQKGYLMDKAYRDYRVREYVGTPNARQKGQLSAVTDNIFMFSHIGMQGWRAALKNMRQNPMSFALKQLTYTVVPNAVKWLTYYGVFSNLARQQFGEDSIVTKTFESHERALRKVGKYNLERYNILPFGFDSNDKAIVGRINMGHFETALSTFLGESIKNVEQDIKSGKYKTKEATLSAMGTGTKAGYEAVTSNMSFGLNPFLDMAMTLVEAIGGENPKDSFYDREVFGRKTFQANDKGRKAEELGKWGLGKAPLLSSWLYNPKHGTEEVHPSIPDTMARFPVFQSPMLNFVVTDSGENEIAAAEEARATEKKARRGLIMDDIIDDELAAEDQNPNPDYREAAKRAWIKARKTEGALPARYHFNDWNNRFLAAAAEDDPKLKHLRNIPKEEQDAFLESVGDINSNRVDIRKRGRGYIIYWKRRQ